MSADFLVDIWSWEDVWRSLSLEYVLLFEGMYSVSSFIIFLVNKTNGFTEFKFLFIGNNNPTCFGQSFCPSSGASQPYNGTGTVYASR